MKINPEILDHWPELSAHFPAGFDVEATARARGAFTRAREIKDAATLLRLALAYGGIGMALRETCAWAEAGGSASLRGPSLLERLCKAGPRLGCQGAALVSQRAKTPPKRGGGDACAVVHARRDHGGSGAADPAPCDQAQDPRTSSG